MVSISWVVCRTTWKCRPWAGHRRQVPVDADWLQIDEWAERAAAAVSAGQQWYTGACQSPADAPPSCTALSVSTCSILIILVGDVSH